MLLFQNLSYENEFDLHGNEPVGRTHEWFRMRTRFDKETQGSSIGNDLLDWLLGNHLTFVLIRIITFSAFTTYFSSIYLSIYLFVIFLSWHICKVADVVVLTKTYS